MHRRAQQLDDPTDRGVRRHGDDGDAGSHRLTGGEAAKGESTFEQPGQLLVEASSAPRLVDQVLEVLGRRTCGELPDRLDAYHPQQAVRGGVEEVDHRPGDGEVCLCRAGERQGERHRSGDREVLGGQLADDHLQHGREDQHEQDREGEPSGIREAGETQQVRERRPDQGAHRHTRREVP